ncbi:pilus (MSHA type) biogenesis protein MshL [Sulfurimonas sp. HSL-3221]|uniref:pilus (MSHA type) biogenesis protein MshL n=1 Tax=Sulfurimonadaceae TaxID=2771471 RepID=UPI001E2A00DA|nr:pilus (MSHA type) biogenesis protein MshL [Sulfurimonas sp. HSL-3221]UFS63196.1 pilus (MSHA type) biogenesis protein MshL [Sulfurimonas sp. HSL-3221]
MKNMTPFQSIHKSITSVAAALLLASSVQAADCTYELFSISGAKGMTISKYVDQLSNECELTLIISDNEAEKKMSKRLQRTNLKNLTLNEVLDILLVDNNLNYTLENNILKISFIETKTYNIDYIISARKSIGSTDILLSSSQATGSSSSQSGGGGGGQGADLGGGSMQITQNNTSGIKIESLDEVKFWEELDLELQRVLNRPTDFYQAEAPIVNKNAGLVTVTATVRQQQRLEKYLNELQKKIQYQVLIDVRMMAVTLSDSSSTGIDWSQIYALQNLSFHIDKLDALNVSTFDTTGNILTGGTAGYSGPASLLKLTGGNTITELVKFLKTQGDVDAISNPKVLTLNNQPALITVGTEYFYKIQQSQILAGSSAGTSQTTQNEEVNSIFAGVLLDITPEIANDNTITLKINPSVSQTRIKLSSDEIEQQKRSMPPDLDRRQLASVVTVKDGNSIIIGGLIDKSESMHTNRVPLLGDIPGLGYLFKYEEKAVDTTELVIVIEPHIIKKENNTLSLSDLGYTKFTDSEAGLTSKETAAEANAE